MQTIESHILDIYENNDDIEIDLNYFELTSKKQACINLAIKKVGTTFLKPIKDIVGKDITYGQIKLCLLIRNLAMGPPIKLANINPNVALAMPISIALLISNRSAICGAQAIAVP